MGKTLARNEHWTIYSRTGYLVFDDWRFFDSDGSNTPNQQLFVKFFSKYLELAGIKKETKYMINTGVKLTLIETVTMHGIQFPPRWPAKRNDQKEISSTPLKMTQKVVHEETKAKQFFVGHDA